MILSRVRPKMLTFLQIRGGPDHASQPLNVATSPRTQHEHCAHQQQQWQRGETCKRRTMWRPRCVHATADADERFQCAGVRLTAAPSSGGTPCSPSRTGTTKLATLMAAKGARAVHDRQH